jgi:FlaA1/EpsC-like NDP-sugar epimerase
MLQIPPARTITDLRASTRLVVLLGLYTAIILASFYVAYELRFDFAVAPGFQAERLRLIKYVVGVKLIALLLFSQMGTMLRYFSIPDLLRVVGAMGTSALVLMLPRIVGATGLECSHLPRGVVLIDMVLSVAGFCALRLALRIYQERVVMGRHLPVASLERIAIIGAGDAGASLANDLLNTPARGFRPVVFLDDDASKHGKLIHGVLVAGRAEQLPELKAGHGIKRVIIAMPSAKQKRVREIAMALAPKGYQVEIMPALEELTSGRVKTTRIRPVEVEDLLGREEVELDTAAIAQFIEGKVVMVTGAGGSIGSELCRQIAKFRPKRLLLVEQSEPSLFVIEQELNAAGMGAIILPLVADILDEVRMTYICSRFKPQVVFHAAAHKHVYMMERQPTEAIRNNSVGTRVLAKIVADHGAEAFVLISTDKAINPTNAMGASKRLAEIHLQALQSQYVGRTKFMMVRFGNVLGSSGSVVPIFKRQIASGGPVTVTHPDVIRFFMTIPEAAGLVMQASVLGQGGEIFVLDMGEPVKIVDLAKQMIELSGFKVGEDIEIKFTGLKPGEKLYEELQHRDERHVPTAHRRIMRFVPNGHPEECSRKAIAELEPILYTVGSNELKSRLQKIVPEYTPHLD